MKATGNHFSVRFFTSIVMAAGIVLVLPLIHNHIGVAKPDLAPVPFIIVLCLLLLTCLAFLRNSRQAQKALAETNQQLSQRSKELEELNHTLEARIEERSKSLMILQAQLLQSEKFSAIGQLASGIAHEINNPIGFINSNLQTLQKYTVHYTGLLGILNKLEKALKDHDREKAAAVVASWEKIRNETNFTFIGGDINNLLKESLEGADKIRRIVADLRALASPDRGVMNAVNIEALMESILNIVHNEIKYKAKLRKEYGTVPLIVCNPQKIGQVFINLLINAVQAIEDKGTILVKTYATPEHVCIEIADTGCGIPPENITRVFDPFFTTKAPGTAVGLGLSLSYDIVRKHKGMIKFNSRVGEGTKFTVMLPVAPPVDDPRLLWRDYERD